MGGGDKGKAVKISSSPIGEVTEKKSPAASGSAGKSTAQSGRSSSQEASSTVQDCGYRDHESEEAVRRSSHARAGPSPHCSLSHTWLFEVETKVLYPPEEEPYWDAEGIEAARCSIPRDDAKHVIGKGGRTLQRLQALSGTLIGVVDRSEQTSIVHIYGRREGQNIVRHFLACLQEEFYGVLGALERALGNSG